MTSRIKDLLSVLKSNQKVMDLVKIMSPSDVFVVLSKNTELHDKDLKLLTKNLLRNAKREGLAPPSIEKNSQYPIPSKLRRDNEVEESYINNLGALVPTVKRYHFPPDPIEEPNDWPYDAMTKAGMDIKNKGRKKPLMQGKNPFTTDLSINQPGGDGGKGIYTKNTIHSRDNSMPSAGSSWDKKGTPGWSSSPPGKQFELPGEETPTVGAPIPKFFGGHSEPRKNGERTGFRRR